MQITTVNGNHIAMRNKLPAKANWELIHKWQKLDMENFDDMAWVLSKLVESWDLPGDCHNPKDYANLDLITEVLPMAEAIGKLFAGKVEEPAKNSESASTSA